MEDMHKVTYTITVTVDGDPDTPSVALELDGGNTNVNTINRMCVAAAGSILANAYCLSLVAGKEEDSEDSRKRFVEMMLKPVIGAFIDAVDGILKQKQNFEIVEK